MNALVTRARTVAASVEALGRALGDDLAAPARSVPPARRVAIVATAITLGLLAAATAIDNCSAGKQPAEVASWDPGVQAE